MATIPELADKDVWNLCNHVARVIAAGARRLLECDHGYPVELDKKHGGDGDAAVAEWHAILAEMATGFEKFATDDIDAFSPEIERSRDLFHRWFYDLWD